MANGKAKKVIRTVEAFSVGGEYDCSYDSYKILKPSKFLFDLLDAKSGPNDSCVYDAKGEIIGLDSSTFFNSPHDCFLVRKDVLDAKLKEKDLELVWYFFGEKQDIGANSSYVYRMLLSGFAGYIQNGLKVFPYFKLEH